MLNGKQKLFLVVFVFLGLLCSNIVLFFAWQESLNNVNIVKQNAIDELVECGCEGYWKGVPYVYRSKDFNIVDLNSGGFVKVFK